MNETNYGFALVMMGIALTPGFSKFVRALLEKNMTTTDYTIMEVCVAFLRVRHTLLGTVLS